MNTETTRQTLLVEGPPPATGAHLLRSGRSPKTTGAQPSVLAPCDREHLLVVDDDRAVARMFRLILSRQMPELDIETAYNGAEAMASFSLLHHAVLLLDLHMPVMDGEQTFVEIERLCTQRRWEAPTLIFCSGYFPPSAVLDAIRQHSRHTLLRKPASSQAIVSAVQGRLSAVGRN